MCYGCNPSCENCKPKFVKCPACGLKNYLFSDRCVKCSAEISEEVKDAARDEWQNSHEKTSSKAE
ncbi:hypothetical protein LPY66_09610 [Dehalobacter sp. DCM]|uniref:hypothetical protein n=1 Tax=Dehalobacter sp. DCM TaxID=2907827 RepID=UPI003081AC3E|nr:hypothetical protein LPY66_09610 [Dehalobacter sp. DCM]